MFTYQFIQRPNFDFQPDMIDSIFTSISKHIPVSQKWIINIVFVSPKDIQELNKKYRNIDKSTDVLSFHYYDDFSTLEKDDVAWELVFCEEKILSQWQEYGLWSEKEFYKLLIHSLLHTLWYDHETDEEFEEMQKWEKEIFSQTCQ